MADSMADSMAQGPGAKAGTAEPAAKKRKFVLPGDFVEAVQRW